MIPMATLAWIALCAIIIPHFSLSSSFSSLISWFFQIFSSMYIIINRLILHIIKGKTLYTYSRLLPQSGTPLQYALGYFLFRLDTVELPYSGMFPVPDTDLCSLVYPYLLLTGLLNSSWYITILFFWHKTFSSRYKRDRKSPHITLEVKIVL